MILTVLMRVWVFRMPQRTVRRMTIMKNRQKHQKRQIQWMDLTVVQMMEQDFRRKTVKTQVPQMKTMVRQQRRIQILLIRQTQKEQRML